MEAETLHLLNRLGEFDMEQHDMSAQNHAGREDHSDHHAMMVADFRRRLSLPMSIVPSL